MIHNPLHPGVILQQDVLAPLELGVTQAAERLGVSRVTLSRILNGHSGISAQVAIRLEMAGISNAETWINLQAAFDLAKARQIGVTNVRPLAA